MLARLEAVAQTSASVLIQGESGVGKELVAHVIHARSPRSQGPLVKVNCASIPHELFESEFFGHVKGAFTGAHRDRVGRFQLADGGTIFLDEVGEIPLDLQSKLLRVLQESEYERVGDDRTHSVNVRVVAATNRDLEQAVAEGKFREDLYYRLSVFPIDVPPLRERGDDVVQIASHFLERTCQEFGHRPLTLSRQQAALLKRYDWPGNIRELKNVIERAVILSRGKVLRLDLAMSDILNAPVVPRRRWAGECGNDAPHGRRVARARAQEHRARVEHGRVASIGAERSGEAARRQGDDACRPHAEIQDREAEAARLRRSGTDGPFRCWSKACTRLVISGIRYLHKPGAASEKEERAWRDAKPLTNNKKGSSMSHLAERFAEAVRTLVSDGPIKQRLSRAFAEHLEGLDDAEFPLGSSTRIQRPACRLEPSASRWAKRLGCMRASRRCLRSRRAATPTRS